MKVKPRGFVSTLLLATCLSVSTQAQRPTDNSTDEAGLWYQVDKIEKDIQTAGVRLTDPDLNNYVNKLTCDIVGPDCNQLRVYVIEAPVFNASMYPNGMMLIFSGLLLRAENEAQVACVIGHEFGHYKNKDSLERWRKIKDWSNVAMLFSLTGAATGTGSAEGSTGFIYLAQAAIQGFSREQEREADEVGFKLTADASYKSDECSIIWGNLIDEQEASSFKRVRKRVNQGSVFSSHPLTKERKKTLAAFAKQTPGGAKTGQANHKTSTDKFLEDWLRTELLAKDYDRHLHLFEALKAQGRNEGILNYYIGEAYRLRGEDGDRDLAFEAWEEAAKFQGAPPELWRTLGEYYRRKKDKPKACLLYTSPSPRDQRGSRMPSSA